MCLDPKLETLNSGNDWAPSNTMNGSNIASNLRKKTHGAIFQSNFPIEMATLRYTDYLHLSLSGQTLFQNPVSNTSTRHSSSWMDAIVPLSSSVVGFTCSVFCSEPIPHLEVHSFCMLRSNNKFQVRTKQYPLKSNEK